MAQNRVRYRRGLPMLAFFDRYGSQQRCEELIRAWRWQCSLVAGTVFESSKVPLPSWLRAMHPMTQAKTGISALELERHLGVSYPTAWLLKPKIMQVMTLREADRQLSGRVEIDDACLGGEVQGGKARRGSPNKVAFVAAVQTTESGQPLLKGLTRFIGMAHLLVECVHPRRSVAQGVSLLSLLANQVATR